MEFIELSTQQRKEIQQLELRILCEVDRICQKHNIHYSVAYGTMIGAVRHHGFIPWDDDLDILMLRNDYIRFKEICKIELGENFFYQSNDTDKEYFYLFDKIRLNNTIFRESFVSKYKINHGIYIDIFPIDSVPDKEWKRLLQYYMFHFFRTGVQVKYLMISARYGKKKVVSAFLRLIYLPFSLKWLYNKAHHVAMHYKHGDCKMACCFFSPYKKKDIYDSSIFKEWSRCTFEDTEVGILKEYDRMLRQLYGDYMLLPPEKDRETKHTITELRI